MADGSQLRRRVRMATADEPIDADSIANQAAGELRQQIEASPIPDRLARVVEEDRPLASRVASAETPLVPEPDDSPSAREVSFRLREPTGRGAVRSALRTPGLSADLRPRSPFGEDETGIAPEPEAAAKPEMADTDILEPEQPDRSPAGPDRDAAAQNDAADELEGLHKAQRRDRRMAIAGGVLRGVQALGAILGRVTGAPGLTGLGGMAGVASGVIPQGRSVEAFGEETAVRKAHRQDRQRAEQVAYEREQDAIQSKRADAQLGVNVENAETGHRMSQARWEEQQRMNRLSEDEQRSRLDPDHQAARNARGVFTSFLEAVAREKPELREDFQDVVDSLPNMSASQIESAIDELRILRNAPQGTRRGGRGNGTGPARPAPASPQSPAEMQQAYDEAVRMRAAQTGASERLIRASYPDIAYALNPDEPGSLIRAIGAAGQQDVNREQQLATQDETMIVPGWSRVQGAPRLQPGAAQEARERVATFNTLSVYAQQMMALANRVDAMQRAGASAGVLSREVARGRHIHEQLISALRTIGNYGVPNGTELQRMESLAPRLDSVDGLLNARNLYDGMRRTIWTSTQNKMRADGYTPERRAR